MNTPWHFAKAATTEGVMIMGKAREMVQLATRIPKPLHRDLKLFCVGNELSIMDVIEQAVATYLKKFSR